MSSSVQESEAWTKNGILGLYRITGILLLGLGGFMLVQSVALGTGELLRPGPGLWPAVLSCLLILLSLMLVVLDRKGDYERWDGKSVKVVLGVASLIAFVLLFETLGFVVAAFLMLVLWLRVFGSESWGWTVGLALAGAIGFHLLFVNALGVPFPDGILPI